jgi:hypothetical protein
MTIRNALRPPLSWAGLLSAFGELPALSLYSRKSVFLNQSQILSFNARIIGVLRQRRKYKSE